VLALALAAPEVAGLCGPALPEPKVVALALAGLYAPIPPEPKVATQVLASPVAAGLGAELVFAEPCELVLPGPKVAALALASPEVQV
jgi:hypothetical protein